MIRSDLPCELTHLKEAPQPEHAACKKQDVDSPVVEWHARDEVDADEDHPEDRRH